MSQESATGQAPVVESFRERLARELAGSAPESNWSLVVGLGGEIDGHEPCADCAGMGFVAHTEQRLRGFAERVAHMQKEASSAAAAWKLEEERKINKGILDEYEDLNKESVCRTCRGSCYRPTGANHSVAVKADQLFTTVSCPRCLGSDRRKHWRLMDTHPGSSAGGDCPGCGGPGYVVPITARPTTKGAPPDGYVELLDDEDVPVYHRPREHHETSADVFVSGLLAESTALGAAAFAYLGLHGDQWSKHAWGRRFAVWPFVRSGERLVTESAVIPAVGAQYDRSLSVLIAERHADSTDEEPNPRRRMLLGRADREARWLAKKIEKLLEKHEASQ